ncbi:MAG: hypothetical protein ILA39_05140 [Bacteroidaceae bacterium]|nr:hypothetical protein [Bacteroidaceae bacterium]
MKKLYVRPLARAIVIGCEEDVMQLITTSKGTETYDDDDDEPADEPSLVRRKSLWDEEW